MPASAVPAERDRPGHRAGWRAIAAAAALLVAAGATGAETGCPPRLRVAFADLDAPPYLLGTGEAFASPPGELVELAHRVLDKLACPHELVRRPMRRVFRELALGELEVAVGFSPSPERLAQARFPLTAAGQPDPRLLLSESRSAYIGLARRQAELESSLAQGRIATLKLGAVRGSEHEFQAHSAGIPVTEMSDITRGMSMLRAGRIELLALPHLLVRQAELAQPPALAMLAPTAGVQQFYAPVSPALWSTHPHFATQLWRALCETALQAGSRRTACPKD